MTELEMYRTFFIARLNSTSRENESPKKFAERCSYEALEALDSYQEALENFDPETGEWML